MYVGMPIDDDALASVGAVYYCLSRRVNNVRACWSRIIDDILTN